MRRRFSVVLILARPVLLLESKQLHLDIVRRAYELWEQAGKPEGRDQEFYHLAEQKGLRSLQANEKARR